MLIVNPSGIIYLIFRAIQGKVSIAMGREGLGTIDAVGADTVMSGQAACLFAEGMIYLRHKELMLQSHRP